MSDTKNTENESSGLKKSLRLIYVYAIAAGAIFTFIGYWDTIFHDIYLLYNHILGTCNPWRLISFALKSVFHIPESQLYLIQFQDKNYLYIMYRVIWLWMLLVNWKKHPVEIETPDGIQKF